MKAYSIYSINTDNNSENIVKTIKGSFSILGILIGPILFLFYRMWKEFLIYSVLLFVTYYLNISGVITKEFYQLCNMSIYLYIGFDFYNLYEQHLLSKGYSFKTRIIAYNKLDMEEKLMKQELL